MTLADQIAQVAWYHRIELAPGVMTPGCDDSPGKLAMSAWTTNTFSLWR